MFSKLSILTRSPPWLFSLSQFLKPSLGRSLGRRSVWKWEKTIYGQQTAMRFIFKLVFSSSSSLSIPKGWATLKHLASLWIMKIGRRSARYGHRYNIGRKFCFPSPSSSSSSSLFSGPWERDVSVSISPCFVVKLFLRLQIYLGKRKI